MLEVVRICALSDIQADTLPKHQGQHTLEQACRVAAAGQDQAMQRPVAVPLECPTGVPCCMNALTCAWVLGTRGTCSCWAKTRRAPACHRRPSLRVHITAVIQQFPPLLLLHGWLLQLAATVNATVNGIMSWLLHATQGSQKLCTEAVARWSTGYDKCVALMVHAPQSMQM